MCKKLLFLLVALAFCQAAMASEIAISTQAGWMGQAAADTQSQMIKNNVTGATVELFTSTQQAALATWVQNHTGDGTADLLILFGQLPNTIYASGNAQPDGSLAELFLDDGNCIVNTGDWIFYVVDGAGSNGAAGLQNMMDIPGVTVAGEDDTAVTVTADGQNYTPSLLNFATDRPFHLDTLANNWETELVLAGNAAGTRADPVIVHNTVTDGRIGIFYQTASQDNDPRGAVISEWINNYFMSFIAAGNPYSRAPKPADGAMVAAAFASMQWTPGDFAASHDIYFGTDQTAVANATTASPEFQGNQTGKYFVVGFPPYALPGGLVPGTTYYWRVDEVNTAEPDSPWKGNVWSFWVPPNKAYNPDPVDDEFFVDPENAVLTWSPGHNAMTHSVYLSTDYDTVANGAPGLGDFAPDTSYSPPGPLQPDTTYYWRVDEANPPAQTLYEGDIWTFKTAPLGGGIVGHYFNGMNFQTYILTRIDDQINFEWGEGSPDADAGVNIDLFTVRWVGEVEIPFGIPTTFTTRSDDGIRLWIDGDLVVDSWIDQGPTDHSGTVDLSPGRYSIIVEYFENGGGAVAHLRWSNANMSDRHVPQAALSPPVRANNPSPGNSAANVKTIDLELNWSPGQYALSHDVYFGADQAAVAGATKASPEFKGSQNLGNEAYVPVPGGELEWDTTYYWRIDEVNNTNADSPWPGTIWNFTTANYVTIEDFEDYNDEPPDRIFETWIDGFGGSTNGSIAGYPYPIFANGEHFCETSIVNGGEQSGPMFYDNNMKYSEITKTLPAGLRDWTQNGVKSLNLSYYGHIASQGSLVEGPAGTYKITGAGADIWAESDQFHYAYKSLGAGAAEIIAKVSAVEGPATDPWIKAGVMIRETLDANSTHAFMSLTNSSGVSFQYRGATAGVSADSTQAGVSSRPQWLRLVKDIAGTFTAYHANDVGGVHGPWAQVGTYDIQMNTPCFIGLAITGHSATYGATASATFSNISTTGAVTGATWTNQDVGIQSNDPERMYVMIRDGAGQMATVYNPDLDAANVSAWTAWGQYGQGIALSEFTAANPSLNLANIDSISLGFGTRGNTTQPGGSGLIFIDDIGLYTPTCVYQLGKPDNDYSNNCVVDMPDLEILTDNWLISDWQVTPQAPSTSGLVANYQFQNNLLDSAGGHTGDPCGTTVAYAAGQTGQAINLGGTAYVTAGNIGITGAAPRTIAGWAKANVPASSIAAWTDVFGLSGASASFRHFDIQAVGDTGTTTSGYYGIHLYGAEDNLIPIDQDWHHLAATYDGTTIVGYADGHQTGSLDQVLDTEGVLQIGKRADNTNLFNGMVDEVRVYSRALPQAEIASLAGKTAPFTQDVGLITTIQNANIDVNGDGTIDFKDYAGLLDTWLDEVLWP